MEFDNSLPCPGIRDKCQKLVSCREGVAVWGWWKFQRRKALRSKVNKLSKLLGQRFCINLQPESFIRSFSFYPLSPTIRHVYFHPRRRVLPFSRLLFFKFQAGGKFTFLWIFLKSASLFPLFLRLTSGRPDFFLCLFLPPFPTVHLLYLAVSPFPLTTPRCFPFKCDFHWPNYSFR